MKKFTFLILTVFMAFGCAKNSAPVKACPEPKVDLVHVDRTRDLEAFLLLEKRILTLFASERRGTPVKLVESHQEVTTTNDMAFGRYTLHTLNPDGSMNPAEIYFTVVLLWRGNIWVVADILAYPVSLQDSLPER